MKELEEALMDRTTASLNRRARITSINPTTIFLPEMEGNLSSIRKNSSPIMDTSGQHDNDCHGLNLKSDSEV